MSYEPDDGPLTDEQMARIRELSPDMPDSAMTGSLIDKIKGYMDSAVDAAPVSPRQTWRYDLSELSAIIHEILDNGGLQKWPMVETQALSMDLVSKLIAPVDRRQSLHVVGSELADKLRHYGSEEYFNLTGNLGPIGDFIDIHHSESGRAAGYVGMLVGMEMYAHPEVPPNAFIVVQPGHESKAVIGYVKL